MVESAPDAEVVESAPDAEVKPVLEFVDLSKGVEHYIKRYHTEDKYKSWFNRNYPKYTIFEAVGISNSRYNEILKKLEIDKDEQTEVVQEPKLDMDLVVKKQPEKSRQDYKFNPGQNYGFENFIDERVLVSHNSLGDKEMKVKILEVSDEVPQTIWKFGDRVKVNKILVTIKHLDSQQIEEGEFDIELIERELAEKRHYTSTNRWVPTEEIKNGYVVNKRHTSLISDAAALDYIIF